jgi:hypothetical protein
MSEIASPLQPWPFNVNGSCWSACLDARPQAPSSSSPSLAPPALRPPSTALDIIRLVLSQIPSCQQLSPKSDEHVDWIRGNPIIHIDTRNANSESNSILITANKHSLKNKLRIFFVHHAMFIAEERWLFSS